MHNGYVTIMNIINCNCINFVDSNELYLKCQTISH